MLAGWVIRNDRVCSPHEEAVAEGASIIALISQENGAGWSSREQLGRDGDVGDITGTEHDDQRSAYTVANRVDLGRETAARAPNGLRCRPPLPPAEARWAFEAELSIIATSVGMAPAKARKSRIHKPCALHRFQRL